MKKNILICACLLAGAFAPVAAQDEVRLPERPNRPAYTSHHAEERGFFCAVELEAGSSVFPDKTNTQPVALSFTAGYRVNDYLRVGAGFGGRWYVNGNDARRRYDSPFTVPLYADVRGNFMAQGSREVVPYWNVKVGGMVYDGFFLSPTVGLRIGERRNAVLVGLSYSFNQLRTRPDESRGASFLLLRVGYEF